MKDVLQNCSRDTLWWFSCLNTEADVSAEITLIEVWTSWLFLGVVGLCSHLSLWIPDSSWWAGDACNGLGVAQLLGLLIFLLFFQAPLWVWRCSPVHCWRVLWSSTRQAHIKRGEAKREHWDKTRNTFLKSRTVYESVGSQLEEQKALAVIPDSILKDQHCFQY